MTCKTTQIVCRIPAPVPQADDDDEFNDFIDDDMGGGVGGASAPRRRRRLTGLPAGVSAAAMRVRERPDASIPILTLTYPEL